MCSRIGNKADCSSSDRQVKREDGERLAREHNVPFMETSAKTGLNVELAFQTVARLVKTKLKVLNLDKVINKSFVRQQQQQFCKVYNFCCSQQKKTDESKLN